MVRPFVLAALWLAFQEHAEFTQWMKAADRASKTLQKPDTRTGPEAVRSAETLGGVYEDMIAFWRRNNAPDAVKWSEQGKAAAVELAAAAHAGDSPRAAEAWKALDATCGACHDAYRLELPDGRYAIRWTGRRQKK